MEEEETIVRRHHRASADPAFVRLADIDKAAQSIPFSEDLAATTASRVRINPGVKETLITVSPHIVPVETDLEPAHVACVVGQVDAAFRSTLSVLSDHAGPLFPWDLDDELRSKAGKLSIDAFKTVLEHSFEPTPSPKIYKKVFNTPQIVMMEHAFSTADPRSNILVVDPRDSDIKRIKIATDHYAAGRDLKVFIQSTRNPDYQASQHGPGRYAYAPRLQLLPHTMDALANRRDMEGHFSTIIFNVNLARYLGDRDRAKFLNDLRRLLSPGGRIFGSYVDHEAVRDLTKDPTLAASNQVIIYNELPTNGNEGTFLTRIASEKAYEDYVLTADALSTLLLPTERLTILPARTYCKQRTVPSHLQSALGHPHIMMIRVAIIETGLPTPLAAVTTPDPDFKVLGLADKLGYPQSFYSVNRGVPFTDVDLFYHHPAHTLVTPKADGVEAIIWTRGERTFMMKRGDNLLYEANFRLPDRLKLQVELVSRPGQSDPLHPAWVVVTDVIAWPGGEIGYAGRMRGARALIGPVSVLTWPQTSPASMHPTLARNYAEYPTDGFVLNHRNALPGMFASGRGAARYIKDFYTVEQKGEDGLIYEVPADGQRRDGYPKLRLDRREPSSSRDLEMVRAAWTVEEYSSRIHYLATMPLNLAYLADNPPRESKPHYIFTLPDLIYLWTPWRDRSIETTIYNRFGARAVEWFQTEIAEALDKLIAAQGPVESPTVEEILPPCSPPAYVSLGV